VVYLDTSVLLAQLLDEQRQPPGSLWSESLVTSRLTHYEAWVRVHGESWRARDAGGAPLASGDRIKVRSVDGLTLIVERFNH
jgi:membrane protein implicated in regulation of membrane protease activity